MKYFGIIVMITALLVSAVAPAYANTRQENNQHIADFVLDTIKLPWILLGGFVTQDHEQVKEDVEYKEHRGLNDALRGEKKFIGK